jgi:hypothetical protein
MQAVMKATNKRRYSILGHGFSSVAPQSFRITQLPRAPPMNAQFLDCSPGSV